MFANLTLFLDEYAPLFYWTVPECCLSVVCACLPSLRPIFQDLSTKSILDSVRNAFSLSSLRFYSHERSEATDISESSHMSKTSPQDPSGESSKDLLRFGKMGNDQAFSGSRAVFETKRKRTDEEKIDLRDLEQGVDCIRMHRRFEQTEVQQ